MQNPLTPAGIEPANFRFVAQNLNHWATAVPIPIIVQELQTYEIESMFLNHTVLCYLLRFVCQYVGIFGTYNHLTLKYTSNILIIFVLRPRCGGSNLRPFFPSIYHRKVRHVFTYFEPYSLQTSTWCARFKNRRIWHRYLYIPYTNKVLHSAKAADSSVAIPNRVPVNIRANEMFGCQFICWHFRLRKANSSL